MLDAQRRPQNRRVTSPAESSDLKVSIPSAAAFAVKVTPSTAEEEEECSSEKESQI